MTKCNDCEAKKTCPFYEKDADECVYDIFADAADNFMKEGQKNVKNI